MNKTMNNREHSNRLLKCERGDMLVAARPMHNLNYAGRRVKAAQLGVPQYVAGHTFQVEAILGSYLLAVDEDGYQISFDRVDMASLAIMTPGSKNIANVVRAVKDSGAASGVERS